MQHNNTDTPRSDSVAMIAKDFPTTPSAEAREYADQIDLTEPQGKMIEALRTWTFAQTDKALRHNLQTWELMQNLCAQHAAGAWTMEQARQEIGNYDAAIYFNAVITLAALRSFFGRDFTYTDRNTILKEDESFTDFESFALLDSEVKSMLEGRTPLDIDMEQDPELYDIALRTANWVRSRRPAGNGGSTE